MKRRSGAARSTTLTMGPHDEATQPAPPHKKHRRTTAPTGAESPPGARGAPKILHPNRIVIDPETDVPSLGTREGPLSPRDELPGSKPSPRAFKTYGGPRTSRSPMSTSTRSEPTPRLGSPMSRSCWGKRRCSGCNTSQIAPSPTGRTSTTSSSPTSRPCQTSRLDPGT
jgi:hypothetical protein